jgi:hypothetical protein
MRLNLEGFEIEIRGDSFVCIDDGAKSLFCAWSDLDPNLQDAFKALAAEIEITVEKFFSSDDKTAFDAVADEYEDPHYPCCGKTI